MLFRSLTKVRVIGGGGGGGENGTWVGSVNYEIDEHPNTDPEFHGNDMGYSLVPIIFPINLQVDEVS